MQLLRQRNTPKDDVILKNLPIDSIHPSPHQARKNFDKMAIYQLSESIKQNGLLQPVVVREADNLEYELIAGERRLRACKMAGMVNISAIIIKASDEQSAILCMVENVHRQQLNFFEVAGGYKQLIDTHHMTQSELAKQLGIQQSTIANKIRLLRLESSIKDKIIVNNLTERHARALLRIHCGKEREKILNAVIKNNLNVQATDLLVNKYLENLVRPKDNRNIKKVYSDWRLLNNSVKSLISKMQSAGTVIDYNVTDLGSQMQMTIVINK